MYKRGGMANPQKEDGYTAIANEIMERLYAITLSGSEYRVILCVLRKTYGWHKKVDKISLSQFEEETNLSRRQVCTILDRLVNNRLLFKEKNKNCNLYQFNKDYEMWVVNKQVTSSEQSYTRSSEQQFTKSSEQLDTYKRKKEKKEITKESKNKFLRDLAQFKNNF